MNTANYVGVTISTNPSNTVCAGTNTVFTANPTNGGSAPVYTWTKNNITVGSNAVTYSDNALNSGDVIGLSLSSNVSCAVGNPASAAPVTITVNALPVVSAIAGGALVVCVNGTTPAFTDATAGGGWSVTSGTGTAEGTTGYQHVYSAGRIHYPANTCRAGPRRCSCAGRAHQQLFAGDSRLLDQCRAGSTGRL